MNSKNTRSWSCRPSPALVASLLLAVVLTGGCQSYEARPLDLDSHHAAFLSRTPESADVQSFAARLAQKGESESEVFDLSDGLGCTEAEVLSLVFNTDLRLARLRAGVTQAGVENAGLWEDPTIGVDLVRIIESTPHPWKVFSSIGLTIPLSGRLELEKQRAGVEHSAELARVAQQEWQTRLEIRRVWTEWSALEAQLGTTREFVQRVDQVLGIVDKLEEAGEMARTEARLFRIERATRAAELAALESRAGQTALRLKQLMGVSPTASVSFQVAGIGPGFSEPEEEASSGALYGRSPAMSVARAEYEVAERVLELEVRRQYPDLQIGPGYGREDGEDQVLLGLNLPIPILNANRRGIAEARAQRELARANAEATLEQIIAAAAAAQVRLEGARRQRQSLETDIVPLVDAQYADARQIAQLGEVNTLVLLESLTRQQDAKLRLVDARREEALARIDVQEIVGPPAPTGSPSSSPTSAPDTNPSSAPELGHPTANTPAAQ